MDHRSFGPAQAPAHVRFRLHCIFGKIVGWPVFMSIDIVTGIVWGFVGGEWKGAGRAALGYCLTGIGILFLAIGVISLGNAP